MIFSGHTFIDRISFDLMRMSALETAKTQSQIDELNAHRI